MNKLKIMIVGVGDLGGKVLDMLSRMEGIERIILADLDEDYLHRRANLSMFIASQFEIYQKIEYEKTDLFNIEKTAETINKHRPDIIFNSSSLQSWRVLTFLPKEVYMELDEAQFGPWLPMHLTLMYKLMQAVKQSGLDCKVVNAAFPDAVNTILDKVGMAPTTGIGNVANVIPALQMSASFLLQEPIDKVQIYFIAQHYISHALPRYGYLGDKPCHLNVEVDGKDVTDKVEQKKLFDLLPSKFRRVGGTEGQLLTASSAARVLSAMINNTNALMHAPGPNGLPGGYPVKVNKEGATVCLPPSSNLTLDDAIAINESGQRSDGIDKIDPDGTVHFTHKEMAIMMEMLDYKHKKMKIDESEDYYKELKAKFNAFAQKFH